MNILFLPAIALIIFFFGYRFYARFVGLLYFPARTAPKAGEADYQQYSTAYVDAPGVSGGTSRHVTWATHFAVLCGATTLCGVTLAAVWGWVPAFLWLVAGSALAGGVYGMGVLWLSLRHPSESLEDVINQFLGNFATRLFTALIILLVASMAALTLWLLTRLLAFYPGITGAFILLPLVAWVLGTRWHRHPGGEVNLFWWGGALLVVAAGLLALSLALPVSFSGALNLDLKGNIALTLDGTLIWGLVVLALAMYAAHRPLEFHLRPAAYLATWLMAVLMLLALGGLIWVHPEINAENFHSAKGAPGTLPWLFVTVTSGVLAGFHLLVAKEITVKRGLRMDDIRYVGYGGVLADAAVAIVAIMVVAAGFADGDKWLAFYGSWPDLQDLPRLLNLYINGVARFVSEWGVGEETARAFAALVVAFSLLVSLTGQLRILRHVLYRFQAVCELSILKNEWRRAALLMGLVLLMAIAGIYGYERIPFWPILGISDLAVAGMTWVLLAAVILSQRQRGRYLLIPAAAVGVIVIWSSLALLPQGWRDGQYWVVAMLLLILTLIIYVGKRAWQDLRGNPANNVDSGDDTDVGSNAGSGADADSSLTAEDNQ